MHQDPPKTAPTASPSIIVPNMVRRVRLLIIGALVAIGTVGLGYYFWFSRPIGSGPAGSSVPRDAFKHPWNTRPVLLVGLGDSVTAGFGARRHYSYFDRLAANPADEFVDMKEISLAAVLPGLVVTNLAISGSTSSRCQASRPRLETDDFCFHICLHRSESQRDSIIQPRVDPAAVYPGWRKYIPSTLNGLNSTHSS